ncbi:hypothetical protein Mapa_003029 [Marchantia paleacea]|nr:hypothetical protein Mapa_003029 [Marchantia paleacea]
MKDLTNCSLITALNSLWIYSRRTRETGFGSAESTNCWPRRSPSVNAMLVTATLVASVTFSALLHPPTSQSRTDQVTGNPLDTVYSIRAVRLFWTFDMMSFFVAIFTIFRCLSTTAMSISGSHHFAGNLESWVAYEHTRYTRPLILCALFGVEAFASLDISNIPEDMQGTIQACCIIGPFMVLARAARTGSHEATLQTMLRRRVQRVLLLHRPVYFLEEILRLMVSPLALLFASGVYYKEL